MRLGRAGDENFTLCPFPRAHNHAFRSRRSSRPSTVDVTRSSARSATSGRGVRDRLRGRARHARRRGAPARPRRIAVARRAARATRERPVGRHVHGRPSGAMAVRCSRVDRSHRHLAGRAEAQVGGGTARLPASFPRAQSWSAARVPTLAEALAAEAQAIAAARSCPRRSRWTWIESWRALAPGTSSFPFMGRIPPCSGRTPRTGPARLDVVYLPPVRPIGHTNRKGRNNESVPRWVTSALRGRSARPRAATMQSVPTWARGTTSPQWSRLRAQPVSSSRSTSRSRAHRIIRT